MNGKFLLDTNIVIALFADDNTVKTRLQQAEEVFVASTAVGELYYGAIKSSQIGANLARIGEFVASIPVLSCDIATARQYAEIKNDLRRRGRPIPENDIWIAGVAVQHGLTLATRDAHFAQVVGLFSEPW